MVRRLDRWWLAATLWVVAAAWAAEPAEVVADLRTELGALLPTELLAPPAELGATPAARRANYALVALACDLPALATLLYAETLAERPDDSVAANNLAWCLLSVGRLDDAEALLTAVRQREPLWAPVSANLATCLAARGDREAAVDVVRRARQAAPDDPDVLWLTFKLLDGLAGADDEAGQLAAALRDKENERLASLTEQVAAVIGMIRALGEARWEEEKKQWARVAGGAERGGVYGVDFQRRCLEKAAQLREQLATQESGWKTAQNEQEQLLAQLRIGLEVVRGTRDATWPALRDAYLDGLTATLAAAVTRFVDTAERFHLLCYHSPAYGIDQGHAGAATLIPMAPDYWLKSGTAWYWFDHWYPVYSAYRQQLDAATGETDKQQIREDYLLQLPDIWDRWADYHQTWITAQLPRCELGIAAFCTDAWRYIVSVRHALLVTRGLQWSRQEASAQRLNAILGEMLSRTVLGSAGGQSSCDRFASRSLALLEQRAAWNPTAACAGNNDYLARPGDVELGLPDPPSADPRLLGSRTLWLAPAERQIALAGRVHGGADLALDLGDGATLVVEPALAAALRAAAAALPAPWRAKSRPFAVETSLRLTAASLLEQLAADAPRAELVAPSADPLLTRGLDLTILGRLRARRAGEADPLSIRAAYPSRPTADLAGDPASSFTPAKDAPGLALIDSVAGDPKVASAMALWWAKQKPPAPSEERDR